MLRRIVNVSGGKDSTVMYTMMTRRGVDFQAVFADTGNEADVTYEYIRKLPEMVGGPDIRWVKADLAKAVEGKASRLEGKWSKKGVSQDRIDEALRLLKPSGNQFLDACLAKGGFPANNKRFCTDYLKIRPITEHVYGPLIENGDLVISYQGTRRDESAKRSFLPARSWTKVQGIRYGVIRPIIDWTEKDVFAYLKAQGVEPNPLYALGATRVGCWPCIFARKSELRLISIKTPETIDRLEKWEELVAKTTPSGQSTFFYGRDLGIPGKITPETHGIREKVKWSRTSRGGRQYELFDAIGKHHADGSETCSTFGLCE